MSCFFFFFSSIFAPAVCYFLCHKDQVRSTWCFLRDSLILRTAWTVAFLYTWMAGLYDDFDLVSTSFKTGLVLSSSSCGNSHDCACSLVYKAFIAHHVNSIHEITYQVCNSCTWTVYNVYWFCSIRGGAMCTHVKSYMYILCWLSDILPMDSPPYMYIMWRCHSESVPMGYSTFWGYQDPKLWCSPQSKMKAYWVGVAWVEFVTTSIDFLSTSRPKGTREDIVHQQWTTLILYMYM